MSIWTGTTGFRFDRSTALVYSFGAALLNRTFPSTELVGDLKGIEIADRLRWQFTSYDLSLEGFCPEHLRHVWMLGKIRASQVQTRPHAHIDFDLFMHSPLPQRVLRAAIAVQGKDVLRYYQDPYLQRCLAVAGLPGSLVPYNTAVTLWNDLKLRDEYTQGSWEIADRMAKDEDRDIAMNGTCVSVIAEQAYLSHFLREKRIRPEECITMPEHVDESDFADIRFSHAWGRSKKSSAWLDVIERSFREKCPQEYADFLRGYELLLERGIASP